MKALIKRLLSGLGRRVEKRGEQIVETHRPALALLPCFHSVHYGAMAHSCPDWLSSDRVMHSDAPIAILVTRKGKVAGVIGFEILGRTILIRQIQGAPKASFHDGTRAEAYLLDCAEQIGVALGMRAIRVVTAETAIAFREAAPPSDRPSEVAKNHMRRNYSYPGEVGYKKRFYWRLRQPTHYRSLALSGGGSASTSG